MSRTLWRLVRDALVPCAMASQSERVSHLQHRLPIALAIVGALLATTCGGSGSGAAAPSATATPTAIPTKAVNIHVANPYSLTLDAQERVIVADGQGRRVVLLDPATGNGTSLASNLVFPIHVAFDRNGGMYVADVDGYQVKKIGANGETTPFLGSGKEGAGGAVGAPTGIDLPWVYAIAFDAKNDLVFIESPKGAGSVRKLETATGKISTIAEGMNEPHGLTLDGQGRYVIADTFNHRIVRVDPATGALTVIAGATERKGFAGDGGPATAATLDQPRQVSYDKTGNLFFADDATNRVRRIGTDGMITTVAGNGTTNISGDDGPALGAGMRGTWGVVVNAAGDLFIASPPAARVRKVDAKTGVITAVGAP
jgi:streptogramin lyase